ncbi:hypothetical protein P8C59_004023 [Phyllachora maydis]|uniref:Kinesin-like protein n=1 Tax=Phyllachora maydis TaxID=1825666 RepID=A0AAD9I1J2_9PEZI|nr:hypothetical protein P8C59_004023 [Phyllachora maydis]
MDVSENTNPTARSGLRFPTQYPSAAISGLQEISESQSNARAMAAVPPPLQGVKRPYSGNAAQPEPKRKLFIERGGECGPSKMQMQPPTATPAARPAVKGSSIAMLATTSTAALRLPRVFGFMDRLQYLGLYFGYHRQDEAEAEAEAEGGNSTLVMQMKARLGDTPRRHDRHDVFEDEDCSWDQEVACYYDSDAHHAKPPASAIPSSRHTSHNSMSSRPTSTSSFATSLGPGSRPPSSRTNRPPIANTFSQSVSRQPRAQPRPRPATAMSNHGGEGDNKAKAAAEAAAAVAAAQQQNAWDIDSRLHGIENQFKVMKEAMDGTLTDRKALEEAVELAKTRANDLERERQRVDERNAQLQSEVDQLRLQSQSLTLDVEAEQRKAKYELEDAIRSHKHELEEVRRAMQDETDRRQKEHGDEVDRLRRHHRAELEQELGKKSRETDELRARLGSEQQDMSRLLLDKDREVEKTGAQLEAVRRELERERTLKDRLQLQLADMATTNMTLEDRHRALRAQIEFLESDSKQQSDSFASMEAQLREAERAAEEARQKLMREETERRILFNRYQELKGNIRVMCRVRPLLDPAAEGAEAAIAFPDAETSSSQIELAGPEERSSLGTVSRKLVPFEFDRVFAPAAQNDDVFGEIAQLVQSALDGYNVCIFAYGQTGSGKTYTMSSADGMIRRATHMIYDTVGKLQEKGWTYSMEGSFVEVYNEELHDLLATAPGGDGGKDSNNKKRLEIRHDEARKQTTVLHCRSVALDAPATVQGLLDTAAARRSVAATRANERSSRSHSVFMLRLAGANGATGERCEGTLNLVDLAGSERLKASGAEGERMRETQSINKSLACLGDVIEALGKGAAHVPYRNSKLTHLLQYSLGGNSKTLMFVMVSPLEAHLKETLTSLRFATKVHNTHIGTAKTTKKIRERTGE